ncbi:hypothetical protein AYI70_g7391 [Smittium culicis]|uniref:Uncharacterized protein n=1 Tax=Smittium culicis TaxID=133412 RepID=A0A1R1XKX1_9FUNG|nr:hypothetical protein AYI70_g7391 [Smittium culicis]
MVLNEIIQKQESSEQEKHQTNNDMLLESIEMEDLNAKEDKEGLPLNLNNTSLYFVKSVESLGKPNEKEYSEKEIEDNEKKGKASIESIRAPLSLCDIL